MSEGRERIPENQWEKTQLKSISTGNLLLVQIGKGSPEKSHSFPFSAMQPLVDKTVET